MSNIQGNVTGNVFGNVIGVIPSLGNFRQQLAGLLHDGSTVANYQPGVGVTGTLNASAWANQIGAAGSLAQATGANQPIVLPFTGAKYAWFPGVSGNYIATPHSASIANLTDFTVIVKVALNSYSPGSDVIVLGKAGSTTTRTFALVVVGTTGNIAAVLSDDGTAKSVNAGAATGFAAGADAYLAMTRESATGAVDFYKSSDGVSWSQVGTTQTGVTGALYNNASVLLEYFSTFGGTAGVTTGKGYFASLYTGIVSDLSTGEGGVLVKKFNASDWSETSTNGATQVSSTTGETWTLNNTAIATPAAIIGSPFIVTNAVAHWMRASYTAAQPRTLYIVGMDPVWAAGQYIADGVTANTLGLSKTTSTPRISLNAGAAAAENAGFTLRAKHILTIGLNGASSFTTVDGGTSVTGDPGAGDPGGLTIGADGGTPTAGSFGGFWYSEIIDRNGTDSAATQAKIQSLLRAIHGTP